MSSAKRVFRRHANYQLVCVHNKQRVEKKEMIKHKRQRLKRRVISEETLTQLSYCCGWDDQL